MSQTAQRLRAWALRAQKPDLLAARSGRENARSRQWEAWLRRQVAVPTSLVNFPSTFFLVLPLSVPISPTSTNSCSPLSPSSSPPLAPPTSRIIYQTADGSKHEGEYKDGKPVGWGIFTWLNGQRYEGEWLDGKPHGKGIFTWRDGKRYEGTTVDGMQVGKGIFNWPS